MQLLLYYHIQDRVFKKEIIGNARSEKFKHDQGRSQKKLMTEAMSMEDL